MVLQMRKFWSSFKPGSLLAGINRPWLFALACLAAVFTPVFLLHSESGNIIGACLLYGVKGAGAYNMPGIPILIATLDALRSSLLYSFIDIAISCGILAVSYSIARELSSPRAGFIAAVFSALVITSDGHFGDMEQRLLALELLCALFYFLRDELSPSKSCKYAGAAMLGCTFMLRSTMALFPPLWGIWAVFRGGWKGWRFRCREVLPAVILPYLFLVPWMFSAHSGMQRNVIFEDGRANSNIITGALGLVGTIEGSSRDLALLNGWRDGDSLYLWAAKQVFSHPWRYMSAVAERVREVALFFPAAALLGISACAVLLFRRRVSLPLLVCSYFVVIHCLMSVEPRYLVPLWLVCAAFAGAASGCFGSNRGTVGTDSRFITGTLWLALMCLEVWVAILLVIYPFRVRLSGITCAEAAPAHASYSLWDCALRENLSIGRQAEAENAARQLVSLLPERLAERRGREIELLALHEAARTNPLIWKAILTGEWNIARALLDVDRGMPCSVLPSQYGLRLYFRTMANNADRKAFNDMKTTLPVGLHDNLLRSSLPREDIGEIEKRLSACGFGDYSVVSSSAGVPGAGDEPFRFREGFHPDHFQLLHRTAIYCQKKGWYRISAALYGPLIWSYSSDPRFLSDRGVARWLAGDAVGAEADFRRALKVSPGFEPAVMSLNAVNGKSKGDLQHE